MNDEDALQAEDQAEEPQLAADTRWTPSVLLSVSYHISRSGKNVWFFSLMKDKVENA